MVLKKNLQKKSIFFKKTSPFNKGMHIEYVKILSK